MHTLNIFVVLATFAMLNASPLRTDDGDNDTKVLYDQRQTGKYNIHLAIKDVAIIKVDENEFLDENLGSDLGDYYYDDSDLTVKPWIFTTQATENSASLGSNNSTNGGNSTTIKGNSTEITGANSTIESLRSNFRGLIKSLPQYKHANRDESRIYNFKMRNLGLNRARIARKCKSGLVADEHGNCRPRGSNTILKQLFSMLSSLPSTMDDDK